MKMTPCVIITFFYLQVLFEKLNDLLYLHPLKNSFMKHIQLGELKIVLLFFEMARLIQLKMHVLDFRLSSFNSSHPTFLFPHTRDL